MAETEIVVDPKIAREVRKAAKRIGAANTAKNEAGAEVMSLYKEYERETERDRGMLKQAIKMAGWDADTFLARWRQLQENLRALGAFDQPELPLEKPAEVAAEARQDEGELPLEETAADEPAEKAPPQPGLALPAETDLGDARARGRRARIAGRDRVDSNMFPQGSVEAQQHDIGWGEEDQRLIDEAARAEPANAGPKRGKRADGNGAAAAH